MTCVRKKTEPTTSVQSTLVLGNPGSAPGCGGRYRISKIGRGARPRRAKIFFAYSPFRKMHQKKMRRVSSIKWRIHTGAFQMRPPLLNPIYFIFMQFSGTPASSGFALFWEILDLPLLPIHVIQLLIYLPPANEVSGKSNVSTPVCHSVHRGCLPHCILGCIPPQADPLGRHPL